MEEDNGKFILWDTHQTRLEIIKYPQTFYYTNPERDWQLIEDKKGDQ